MGGKTVDKHIAAELVALRRHFDNVSCHKDRDTQVKISMRWPLAHTAVWIVPPVCIPRRTAVLCWGKTG